MNKREFDTAQRTRMAESGIAMPDGSFPIATREDLANAIRSVGRAADYDKAKRHIISRARVLGAVSMLPEDWGVKKDVWGGKFAPFTKG
jgi:hypothetical protein